MRSLEDDAGDGFEFFVAELRLFAFRPDFGSFLGEWVGNSSWVSVVMLGGGFLVVELVRQRSPFLVLLGQGCKV